MIAKRRVGIPTTSFRVVAIPKTMGNDVFGTDYCIGFSTAVLYDAHTYRPKVRDMFVKPIFLY